MLCSDCLIKRLLVWDLAFGAVDDGSVSSKPHLVSNPHSSIGTGGEPKSSSCMGSVSLWIVVVAPMSNPFQDSVDIVPSDHLGQAESPWFALLFPLVDLRLGCRFA